MSSTKTVTQHKTAGVHGFKVLTDGEPAGTFEAVVSVFNNVDLGGDRVVAGAFAKTLDAWKASGDPIPVIFSHRWDDPKAHLGVVKDAAELAPGDPRLPTEISANGGLWIKGALDVNASPEESYAPLLWGKMRQRAIKEFSFAYDVQQARPGPGGALDLMQLDLIEVGPTLKGMNPLTALVGVKTRETGDLLRALDIADQLEIDLLADPEVIATVFGAADRDPSTKQTGDANVGELASAIDTVLDEIIEARAAGDEATVDALLTAADSTSDDLLEVLGVTDPDDDDNEPASTGMMRRRAATKRLPAGATIDGAIENTLDAVFAAADVWAQIKYGRDLYAVHLEATILGDSKAVITAERWEDPLGYGPVWELSYTMDSEGLATITDATELEVTVQLNAKRAARAERALRDVGRSARKLGTAANNGKTQGPHGSPVEAESTGLHPGTALAQAEAMALGLLT
jgi:HK97 family phage prohead protease